MNRRIILSAVGITLLGSAAVLAQGQPAGPQKPMTFFIAGAVPGTGDLLMMEDPGPACLRCVGLDDLEFLPIQFHRRHDADLGAPILQPVGAFGRNRKR